MSQNKSELATPSFHQMPGDMISVQNTPQEIDMTVFKTIHVPTKFPHPCRMFPKQNNELSSPLIHTRGPQKPVP